MLSKFWGKTVTIRKYITADGEPVMERELTTEITKFTKAFHSQLEKYPVGIKLSKPVVVMLACYECDGDSQCETCNGKGVFERTVKEIFVESTNSLEIS